MNTIFERNKDKTRVLIVGNEAAKLFFHVIEFHEKVVDTIVEDKTSINGSDFVVFYTNKPELAEDFHPNIFFLESDFQLSENSSLINSLTGGGVFIYSEKSETVLEHLETTTNYFRKLPYQEVSYVKNGENVTIETELGHLPLSFSDENLLRNLDGIRLLCQQFGVMEEEFYEAFVNFTP